MTYEQPKIVDRTSVVGQLNLGSGNYTQSKRGGRRGGRR